MQTEEKINLDSVKYITNRNNMKDGKNSTNMK